MPDMNQAGQQDHVTIAVQGEFDLGAATTVCERILGALGLENVRVDFSLARGVHDTGLAAMAEVLRNAGSSRVSVRGLGAHQRRILRYMGVEPAEPEPAYAGFGSLAGI